MIGLDIAHLAASKPGAKDEIDFVLTIGTKRVPIEVKYQATIDPARDTSALRSFMDKPANEATFGLLVTRRDVPAWTGDPRVVALPLSSLMLLR